MKDIERSIICLIELQKEEREIMGDQERKAGVFRN